MLALIFITLRSMLFLVVLNNLKKRKQYVYRPAIDSMKISTTVPWSGRNFRSCPLDGQWNVLWSWGVHRSFSFWLSVEMLWPFQIFSSRLFSLCVLTTPVTVNGSYTCVLTRMRMLLSHVWQGPVILNLFLNFRPEESSAGDCCFLTILASSISF